MKLGNSLLGPITDRACSNPTWVGLTAQEQGPAILCTQVGQQAHTAPNTQKHNMRAVRCCGQPCMHPVPISWSGKMPSCHDARGAPASPKCKPALAMCRMPRRMAGLVTDIPSVRWSHWQVWWQPRRDVPAGQHPVQHSCSPCDRCQTTWCLEGCLLHCSWPQPSPSCTHPCTQTWSARVVRAKTMVRGDQW